MATFVCARPTPAHAATATPYGTTVRLTAAPSPGTPALQGEGEVAPAAEASQYQDQRHVTASAPRIGN